MVVRIAFGSGGWVLKFWLCCFAVAAVAAGADAGSRCFALARAPNDSCSELCCACYGCRSRSDVPDLDLYSRVLYSRSRSRSRLGTP